MKARQCLTILPILFFVFANANLAQAAIPKAVQVTVPDRTCNVRDFGAKANSIDYDTEAFQKAIDSCAEQGGGTVLVPRGYYLSAPLFLQSNIRFHLQKGAVIQASVEDQFYHPTEATQRWAGKKDLWPNSHNWLAFLNLTDASNVAITGEGAIDGQGAVWWDRWRANARQTGSRGSTNRPRLVFIQNAKNILIEGVTLMNSASFHIVFYNTDGITIHKTTITAPDYAQNTDAIDPMDSQNVRITNNTISVGDDHVAVKSVFPDPNFPEGNSKNIYVANNTFLNGRGVCIGSETMSGVTDMIVENNVFRGSMYGIRIKSPRGRGGNVKNIVYRNNKMIDVETPIVLTAYYRGTPNTAEALAKLFEGDFKGGFVLGNQIYPPDTDPAKPVEPHKTPFFENIRFENLTSTGRSDAAMYVIGLPEMPMKNIVFQNVSIEAKRGAQIRNASVIDKGLKIKTKDNKPFIMEAGAEKTSATRTASR
jgi:polygalacturonase